MVQVKVLLVHTRFAQHRCDETSHVTPVTLGERLCAIQITDLKRLPNLIKCVVRHYALCYCVMQKLCSMVHEMVGCINGHHGILTHVPIHHLDRQLSLHALCSLYAMKDVDILYCCVLQKLLSRMQDCGPHQRALRHPDLCARLSLR